MGSRPQPAAAERQQPLRIALVPIAALAAFSALPWVRANPRLAGSLWGAVACLLLFLLILRRSVARSGRSLSFDFVPRPVHYVQFVMHSSIYVYWGWHWREVYHYAPLILAQIAYVYALDMLVCWSRRDKWTLGFGPVPIVLSTNLFLWFKDDWFFLQFLLVSTGVLCKEFITWKRDGRRAHVFNPSAIALAIFSFALIATHSTHISWAEEVAVTLNRPPNIYIEIFLLGLVVQALFSVTLVTLSAAAVLYLLNVAYTGSTGVYYFVDSNIPAAVFLGLHLLVTDPATSPRRRLGKVIFGAAYGICVFGLYSVLGWLGAPTFYDKLLCVPPLNLTVRLLDRFSVVAEVRFRSLNLRPLEWISALTPRQANFGHMGVWIGLFLLMAGTGFLSGRHPGQDSGFWHKACDEGRRNGCETWVHSLDVSCNHGGGRSCLTVGALREEGRVAPRDLTEAAKDFARACDLAVPNSCSSLVSLVQRNGPHILQPDCDRGDGESCFVLASLYHAGGGVPRDYTRAVSLFQASCKDGWPRGCGGVGECYKTGRGVAADLAEAARYFEKACRGGVAASCFAAGAIYRGSNDEALARERFRKACDLSVRAAIASTAYFAAGTNAAPGSTPSFCSEDAR
jgi:TPR repeat protein